jgi:peptidoglycan/LPS O-acetylase OafA/YrhL
MLAVGPTSLRGFTAAADSSKGGVERPVYLPQLDGQRCVAVLLVIAAHAGPQRTDRFGEWGIGVYGVWLFYVLAGFLITGILLRMRGRPRGLGIFYARRALRIMPPYYLVLATLLIVWEPIPRVEFVAYALYLTNWLMIAAQGAIPFGHFWTLAVEEQFYLLWPVLVLHVRKLPALFVGACVVAVAVRASAPVGELNALQPTPANFDSFGLGGLLAWHHHSRSEDAQGRARWVTRAGWLALGLMFLTLTLSLTLRLPRVLIVLEPLSASLGAVWWIDRCTRARGGRFLMWRPVAALGRLSYSVYLVQTPITLAVARAHGNHGLYAGSVRFFLLVTALSVTWATASWWLVERPALSLKRWLPYEGAGMTRASFG